MLIVPVPFVYQTLFLSHMVSNPSYIVFKPDYYRRNDAFNKKSEFTVLVIRYNSTLIHAFIDHNPVFSIKYKDY